MGLRSLPALIAVLLLLLAGAAAAAVRVEIAGVEEEALRRNVEAYLEIRNRDLGSDTPEPLVRRLYARADENIRQALRPFGYYEPRIASSLTRDGEDWRARFEIDPGEPVRLETVDVAITGEGREDPALRAAVQEAGLRVGDRLRHDVYDALKSRLADLAAARGYFEARFTRSELVVDPARRVARVRLRLDTGPRYRLGAVRVEQDFLEPSVVERAVDIEPGEPFLRARLRATELALYDMGYFALVDVEAVPEPATREVPVTIRLAPARRHRWTVGGGYSTDTSVYVKGGWDNRIANRHGHRMALDLRLSEPKQDLLYRYIIPYRQPLEHLTLLAGYIREDRADTRSERFELAPIDTRYWGRWQRDLFTILEIESSEAASLTFDDALLIPGIRALRTQWNDIARPTRGYKLAVELRGSAEPLGSGTDFTQVRVRSAGYVPLARRLRLYLRAEVGATEVDTFDELPVSQRFFAGGDRSVRGYDLNELSPVDEDGERVGGRHLLFGSVELEFDLLPSWALAAFTDAGNALDEFDDPLETSAGLGFRWRSPIGQIGLDLAQPLSEDDRGMRLHLSVRPEL